MAGDIVIVDVVGDIDVLLLLSLLLLLLLTLLQYSLQVEDTVVTDGNPSAISHRHSEHGLTSIAWSDCVFEPAKIAVGGYSRRAVVWTFDGNTGSTGKWREVMCVLYILLHTLCMNERMNE